MKFKEFLIEATSGSAKWEKYFADSEKYTKMKNDSQLYTKDGVKIPNKIIKKGEVIIVPVEDKYNPKTLIVFNDEEYRVSLNDVDKPITVVDKLQLKPDFFNVTGEFKASSYKNQILKLIKANSEIDPKLQEYLIALIEHAFGKKNSKDLKEKHDAIASEKKILNTINKDFLEIIGPVIAKKELKLPDSIKYLFPEAGNEPLYDFKIIDGTQEYLFSSKSKKTSHTNTMKTNEIFANVKGIAKFKKQKAKLRVLEIISSTAIKDTPAALASFIKSEFGKTFKVPDVSNKEELVKVERQIVDFLNEKYDFVDMINASLPQLWFIKLQVNNNGEVDSPDIQHGQQITKAKLRTKNSPGHYIDRIGFQI